MMIEELNIKDTIKDYLEKHQRKECFAMTLYTDRIYLQTVDDLLNTLNVSKLLECRVFHEEGEIRIKRTALGKQFMFRNSDMLNDLDSYRESYFLDIDATAVKNDISYSPTTGRKSYNLPQKINFIDVGEKENRSKIANNQMEIEYYLSYYPETGQAFIKDWRIVGFKEVAQP